jgi:hypothetical protein
MAPGRCRIGSCGGRADVIRAFVRQRPGMRVKPTQPRRSTRALLGARPLNTRTGSSIMLLTRSIPFAGAGDNRGGRPGTSVVLSGTRSRRGTEDPVAEGDCECGRTGARRDRVRRAVPRTDADHDRTTVAPGRLCYARRARLVRAPRGCSLRARQPSRVLIDSRLAGPVPRVRRCRGWEWSSV